MPSGGTIASRYNRFDTRKSAVDEINKRFLGLTTLSGTPVLEKPLEVAYYDGLPSSEENLFDKPIDESEVVSDVETAEEV